MLEGSRNPMISCIHRHGNAVRRSASSVFILIILFTSFTISLIGESRTSLAYQEEQLDDATGDQKEEPKKGNGESGKGDSVTPAYEVRDVRFRLEQPLILRILLLEPKARLVCACKGV